MKYILKKTVATFFVLVGVVLLIFFLFQGLGDPSRMLIGQTGNKETMNNIRNELHLDESKGKQLLLYLNDLSPVSFYSKTEIEKKQLHGFFFGSSSILALKLPYLGRSYQTKKAVTEILSEALPATLVLTATAMIFAIIAGILFGILAALKKDSWLDNSIVFTTIGGISAPSFFMAILIVYLFAILLHSFTGFNITGSLYEIDDVTGRKYLALQNLVLPALTLGIRPLAIITQVTRSTMLAVLSKDYIRTARAKGLSFRRIIFVHALPNAINPVITVITGWTAELLAGAFFVEYIFGWNGIGKVTVNAFEKLDYPVVMGSILFNAGIFIVINNLTDFIHAKFDPRIRL